jgi:hypothetical protein
MSIMVKAKKSSGKKKEKAIPPKLSIAWTTEGGKQVKQVIDFSQVAEKYLYLNPMQGVKDVGEIGYSDLSEFEGTITEIFEDLHGDIYGDRTPEKMWLRLKRLVQIAYRSKKGEMKKLENKQKVLELVNKAITRLNKESTTTYELITRKTIQQWEETAGFRPTASAEATDQIISLFKLNELIIDEYKAHKEYLSYIDIDNIFILIAVEENTHQELLMNLKAQLYPKAPNIDFLSIELNLNPFSILSLSGIAIEEEMASAEYNALIPNNIFFGVMANQELRHAGLLRNLRDELTQKSMEQGKAEKARKIEKKWLLEALSPSGKLNWEDFDTEDQLLEFALAIQRNEPSTITTVSKCENNQCIPQYKLKYCMNTEDLLKIKIE